MGLIVPHSKRGRFRFNDVTYIPQFERVTFCFASDPGARGWDFGICSHRLCPGGFGQALSQQFIDLALEPAVIFDLALALQSLLLG